MKTGNQVLSERWKSPLPYQEGYFMVHYLANAPELQSYGFGSDPFYDFRSKKNCFTTKSDHYERSCYIHEIEPDLWVTFSEMHHVRRDLCFSPVYDESLPNDYYSFSLYIDRTDPHPSTGMQRNVLPTHVTGTFFKPGAITSVFYMKGSKAALLTVFFKKEWFRKNIMEAPRHTCEALRTFFHSEKENQCISMDKRYAQEMYQPVIEIIVNNGNQKIKNSLALRARALQLIIRFSEPSTSKLPLCDRHAASLLKRTNCKLSKARQLLHEAIFSGFPTIKSLAREVGLSETKLKIAFKARYSKTLYQYYGEYQMRQAQYMLATNDHSIKYVAYVFGYSNPSKFSAAFKKVTGVLPSEFKASLTTLK